MKTIFKKQNEIERKWFLIDAKGKRLGRVAVQAATILQGKNKPTYVPNEETGDYVVIINADKVELSGRKRQNKIYYHHSGYPGGIYAENFEDIIARKPSFPLENAIKGMLPKNKIGRKIINNVKVYAGEAHPHAAQKPEKIEID
ncbi:MAG: 50S ribosomal protein L13 [Spirochaetia bacterium]